MIDWYDLHMEALNGILETFCTFNHLPIDRPEELLKLQTLTADQREYLTAFDKVLTLTTKIME